MAPRGKIVLARINKETKRRASLRKRQPGLLKKVSELSTLCNVEAAVLVYSPGDNQPKVWPSTSEARATISNFLSRPELERIANSHTAKSFMEEKCMKLKNKAQRMTKMNEERVVKALITSLYTGKTRIQDLDSEQQKKLSAGIDKKEKDLLKNIQRLSGKEQQAFYLPEVLPPAVQMPQVSQAGSNLNMNCLARGRNFPSPAVAHEQLMNIRGMTHLAPLPLSLPTHNPLVMSPYDSAANRHDMTRRLYGQTHLGCMMQRASRQSQTLPPALPPLIQVASEINMNNLSSGKNFPSPTAAAHGRHINLRSMTRRATSPIPLSLPTPNPLVMSPGNSAVSSFDMTQSLNGQGNFGSMMQHPLPSTSSMPPPALSAMPTVFSAGSVPYMSDYTLINASTRAHIVEGNFGIMKQHALPPSLPLDYSLLHPSSNRLHMTGRLEKQINFGGTMQHSLDTTDNGLINASFRKFTEDGDFGEMIQHGMHLELPRRLGLPPTPRTEYETSGANMFSDEYGSNTGRFPTPATAALDDSNLDGGMSNAGWPDADTAYEVRNAPPSNI
ncbi:hypothetical protein POM88_017911 [Heracleum sosnowskyi]|uniref:MADS-box domain-containing protein n=1 Tax=Heracleum sosnowskyi TaxID=360622 RepID=A0AAD8MZV9_9APIA|nr:hypothetical protein POM88_017911 [Heracleum sosnowskyi]